MASTRAAPRVQESEGGQSKSKKRRTTDADWAEHKPKLIRLYIDKKQSKKELVEILREEDGLDIT